MDHAAPPGSTSALKTSEGVSTVQRHEDLDYNSNLGKVPNECMVPHEVEHIQGHEPEQETANRNGTSGIGLETPRQLTVIQGSYAGDRSNRGLRSAIYRARESGNICLSPIELKQRQKKEGGLVDELTLLVDFIP